MRRITNIWGNSLVVIAILGLSSLILANFVQRLYYVLLFGQILSIVAFSVLFFQCFMMLILDKARTASLVLVWLGSGGICFGYVAQLMEQQFMTKPPVLHIASVILAVGIIIFNNKNYFNG